MENSNISLQRENCCPLLCILKTVLFAVVIIFMLFIPLGDPRVVCHSVGSSEKVRTAMCYISEGYLVIAKAVDKMMEVLDFLLCVIMDLMYEAKIKFYKLLERMDRRDFCSTVCCSADNMLNSEESKEKRCPQCKCVKKKCSRRRKPDCQFAQL